MLSAQLQYATIFILSPIFGTFHHLSQVSPHSAAIISWVPKVGLSWTGWSVGGPPTQAGIQSDVDQVKYLWMQNHIKSPSRESLLHRVSSCLVMVHHCSSFLIYGSVKVRQASHAESVSGTQPLVPYQAAIDSALKVLPSWKLSTETCIFIWVPIFAQTIKEYQRTLDHGLPVGVA